MRTFTFKYNIKADILFNKFSTQFTVLLQLLKGSNNICKQYTLVMRDDLAIAVVYKQYHELTGLWIQGHHHSSVPALVQTELRTTRHACRYKTCPTAQWQSLNLEDTSNIHQRTVPRNGCVTWRCRHTQCDRQTNGQTRERSCPCV